MPSHTSCDSKGKTKAPVSVESSLRTYLSGSARHVFLAYTDLCALVYVHRPALHNGSSFPLAIRVSHPRRQFSVV